MHHFEAFWVIFTANTKSFPNCLRHLKHSQLSIQWQASQLTLCWRANWSMWTAVFIRTLWGINIKYHYHITFEKNVPSDSFVCRVFKVITQIRICLQTCRGYQIWGSESFSRSNSLMPRSSPSHSVVCQTDDMRHHATLYCTRVHSYGLQRHHRKQGLIGRNSDPSLAHLGQSYEEIKERFTVTLYIFNNALSIFTLKFLLLWKCFTIDSEGDNFVLIKEEIQNG